LKERMEFLDVEIDEAEDREWSETGAEEEHYRMGRSRTTELFDCRTETRVGDPRLVYFPIFQIDYEVRGRVFRATFDGTSDTVVKAELPMPGYLRAVYAVAGYALILLGVGIAAASAHPAALVVGSVVAASSGVLVHTATLSQRTKRG
jgi:hypothetical protein